jgi:RHS repeat-associated protein
MSGKVTALDLDVITEKSGHSLAPILPSVCITPAAPSPLPVPYPASGSSRQGVIGSPSRTKINGAPIGTVGGAFEACHGNEPGTLKEVVSLNTGGAASILVGAPTVICELGMMGITGSPLLANKGAGNVPRSSPAPMLGPLPGMAAGVAVLGGGGAGGGADGDGAGDGGGEDGAGGGGAGDGAEGDGRTAPGGQDGASSGGHPVDVVTGRAFTLPIVDVGIPGPLPLRFARVYSTTAAARDVGIGHGWGHSWGWEIEARRRALVVWSDEGIATSFPPLALGAEAIGPWGWLLRREVGRFVLDTGDGLTRTFAPVNEADRRFRLVEIADRNDNRIALTYDGARLVEVLDSAGRIVRVQSTREGRIAAIQAPDPRQRGAWIALASYSYDDVGDLAAAIDAEGHAARYAYDDDHRLTCETDRTGLAFRFVYDNKGRCVETWGEYPGRADPSLADELPARLADGRTKARGVHHVRLDYHPGRYTEIADSTQIRRYFGNVHGLVDKKIEGFGVETAVYDDRGFVTSRTDGEEATTSYVRDARGRVLRVADPLGRVTTYERDAHGRTIQIVDPAGGATTIRRDERGNVIHVADPTGATTSYERDARGLVVAIVSPTNARTRITYDSHGNAIERREANGGAWRWQHDALGRVTSTTDPASASTLYQWSDRGDLISITDAAGGVSFASYDDERRPVARVDPEGHTTRIAWGGYGRIVEQQQPTGETVRFRYNREGELLEILNGRGEAHRLRYNAAGLLVEEQTFDGRRLTYRYDHTGRLTRSEDGARRRTDRAYNAAGELIGKCLADDVVQSFAYDARGALIHAGWPGGDLVFERDAAGRVVRETQALQGETFTIDRTFDPSGDRVLRRTSLGHVEAIERDAMGGRERTILDERHTLSHTRDRLGRETAAQLLHGGRIESAYTSTGDLEHRVAVSPTTTREPDRVTVDREYRYSRAGDLSDVLDRRRGWVQYEHDAAGRLRSVLHEQGDRREAFTYDDAGNLFEDAGPAADVAARTYEPGGRLVRQGATLYTWNEAGQLREKSRPRAEGGADVWRYTWDASGWLAAVELPDKRRIVYAYDPLGRRLEARTFGPGGGKRSPLERTRFVWDGDALVHAIRTVGTSPPVETRTFCFEDGGFVPRAQCETRPDALHGERSTWLYFVNDPAGTPDELVTDAGEVCGTLDRAAWGTTTTTGRARTPIRFQGQQEDAETGLFYNRFRYYDPEAGRYISSDPIGLAGGLQLFAYVPSPLGWIDPFGLVALDDPGHSVYGLYGSGQQDPYYVGTSNNPDRRDKEHDRTGRLVPGASLKVFPGSKDLPYATARGQEQARIEQYGTKPPDGRGTFPGNVNNSFDHKRTDERGQAFEGEYQKAKADQDGARRTC